MPPTTRTPRIPSARYGIAEWYGKDITTMTPEERQTKGRLACEQEDNPETTDAPLCPFLSTLIPGALCNKKGGVCSIRKFAAGPNGSGTPVPGDKIVTLCPNRFLEPVAEGKSLFEWISEKMLDVEKPTVVKETPFLRKVSGTHRPPEVVEQMAEEEEEEKKAGRIDWIVVDPASMEAPELRWAAVETQALYFSGNAMRWEFDAYAESPKPVLYPIKHRRPDYRSSGPKRLAPQIDVKAPVLLTWGKKVAVVIDRFFFESMNNLEESSPRARTERDKRDNSTVVWFIVDYTDALQLRVNNIIYSDQQKSTRALNATEPLEKDQFTQVLKGVITNPRQAHKVFRA